MTAQKVKMPKKRKHDETKDNLDSEEPDDTLPEKKTKPDTEDVFCIEKFLIVLDKGGDVLAELFKFVNAADSFASGESTVDVVKQYLDRTDGSYQCITSLLDGVKTGSVMHMAVYQALERIICRLPEDFKQYVNTALVSVQQMLQKYSRLMHMALCRTAKYGMARAALRLLTSIVTLGPEGARYATSVVNFETVDFTTWFNTRNRKDPEDVRTCAVFLLMSILVVGSNSVARQVLQAKGLVNNIFPGLLYDRASFICSFLSTFQTKVVENMSFTKTIKLKMLNDKTLKYVTQLLSWEGPKPWKLSGKWNKYKAQRESEKEDPEAVVEASTEDVELVQSTAYKFLISVCCSYKHGILFRDPRLGQSRQNLNFVVTQILLTMEHPYEYDRCLSFVVEVLKVAPDQIGHYLHGWQPILMYATAATAQKLISLYTQVVEVQDFDSTVWALAENVPEKVCRLISYFSLLSLVRGVGEAESIQKERNEMQLQLAHMRFVGASLRKVQAAMAHVRNSKSSVNARVKSKLPRMLCQDVWRNVPTTASLVDEYRSVVEAASSEEAQAKGRSVAEYGAYCAGILDVLNLYRGFSQDFHAEYDWKMLSELAGIQTDALDSQAEDQCLQLRAISLVLESCPASEALMTSEEGEKSPFCHLLELFARCREGAVGKSAASLISKLLCNLNVLEGYSSEVDLWMEKFRLGQNFNLVHLLLRAVKLVITDSSRLNSEVMRYVMGGEASVDGGQPGTDLWSVLKQDEAALKDAEEMESFNAGTYFSPLVPAIFESLKEFSDVVLKRYVHSVIKNILHHQQHPLIFCKFLSDHSSVLSKSLRGYISIWSSATLPKGRPVKEEGTEVFCSKAERQLEGLFLDLLYSLKQGKDKPEEASGKTIASISSCSLFECTSLFYQAMFYTRKLFDSKSLVQGVSEMLQILKAIFERTGELRTEKEEPATLLNRMLRDETTLSYYLYDKDDDLLAAALQYSDFLLDTIVEVLQSTASVPPELQTSLRFLKGRSMVSLASGILPKRLDSSKMLCAFGSVFTESDTLTLLEVLTCTPSKKHKKSLGTLLSTWLECACREGSRRRDVPLLSATVIQNMLSVILDCKDKASLLAAFVQFLEFRPIYVFALGSDDLRRLLEDETSACIDVVNFLMKHNVLHRQALQQLIPTTFKPSVSHLSPASLAGFLRSLSLGLTKDGAPRRLAAWLTKTFLTLPKRMCALKDGVSRQVVEDMMACLESLMKLGQLGNDEIAKLVEILADTAERQLQLALLNALCRSLSEELADSPVGDSCLHTLLQCVANLVGGHSELPEHILHELEHAVATARAIDEKVFGRVVRQDGLWPQFIKNCLKAGFQSELFGKTSFELLSAICQKVYGVDNVGDINPALCRVYMMMFGHSRFLPLMLDTDPAVQARKDKMLELMAVLVQCDPSLCNIEHVPVFLSAYGASLSIVDQRLLYLISIYEKNGVDVCNFKPFLWGPSAVSFYSLHKKASVSLLKQPKSEEVLNLINEDKMAATVLRFPLHLELDVVPLENVVDDSLYDPRFVLPLLYTLLSPGSLVNCRQIVETRCLSLILMSLSSEVFEVRCLGCNLVMLLHHHLQGSRFALSSFWLSVLETLRNAATVTCPHVPCLVAGYLASAVDVISDPGHYMFNAVVAFLLAKPVLDIANVPDFYKMFYNFKDEHYLKRNWLLGVVADYLRCGLDFHLCKKRYVFNILLTFFMSPLCQRNTKEIILRILIAAVKIPKAARILCREQGLLMWLPAALERNLSASPSSHTSEEGDFPPLPPASRGRRQANSAEEGIPELLFETVYQVWKSSFVKTLRIKDLQAARARKLHATQKDEEAAAEESADDEEKDESNVKEDNEAAEILAKRENLRYYEYFPYEFLLMLFSTRKYVRACMNLDAFTKFTEQLGDILQFVRAREASGKSKAAQNCCLPNRDVMFELIDHWGHFENESGFENCQVASRAIASICHHWPPDDATQAKEWLTALDFSLRHGAETLEFNADLLMWVHRWLEGVHGAECAEELVTFSGGHCLEKLLARIHLSLGEVVASGEEARSDLTHVILNIADVLFSKASKTLPSEQSDMYRKEVVLLRLNASMSDLDKALATSVLFHELLLRVTKTDASSCT